MKSTEQHYYNLGITEGKRKFKTIDFIRGLAIGFGIGLMIAETLNVF